MSIDTTELEHQRLRKIAHEYRQRGYDVITEPEIRYLPDFLQPFRVDMIARNNHEQVVIEVRSHDSMTNEPELDALARAVNTASGWRFELVVTNPKDKSSSQFKDAISLEYAEIAYRLREAHHLAEQEAVEAALLLAWSATEALLRYLARKEDITVSQGVPGQLIKALYSYGVIDESQYRALQQIVQVRNTVVHGYRTDHSVADTLDMLLRLADQLFLQNQDT